MGQSRGDLARGRVSGGAGARSRAWSPPMPPFAPEVFLCTSGPLRPRKGKGKGHIALRKRDDPTYMRSARASTSPRSTGFCVIWGIICSSSSSSMRCGALVVEVYWAASKKISRVLLALNLLQRHLPCFAGLFVSDTRLAASRHSGFAPSPCPRKNSGLRETRFVKLVS